MGRTARNYPKGKLKLRTPKELQSGKRWEINPSNNRRGASSDC